MRKLLGVLAVCSLCLSLNFGVSGCAKPNEKGGTFAVTTSPKNKLDKKGAKVAYGFPREIAEVDPKENEFVKITFSGKEITVEQLVEPPADDKALKVKVKSKDTKDKEHEMEVVVHKKAGSSEKTDKTDKTDLASKDMDLEPKSGKLIVDLVDGSGKNSFKFTKGVAEKVIKTMPEKLPDSVAVKLEDGTLWVMVTKGAPIVFDVEVGAKGGKGSAMVKVDAAIKPGTPTPTPEMKKFTASALVGTLDNKDAKVEITFPSAPKRVVPTEKEGVKAVIAGNKVVFTQTVESPAVDATPEFTVYGGVDDTEDAKIKITVTKKKTP
jgi:hypothetical protein